jgi:hypothetical protein
MESRKQKKRTMDKYYITVNIGYGHERVQWLAPFDSREEAEAYLAKSQNGDWDGVPDIEEVLACRHPRTVTFLFACGNCGVQHDTCMSCDWVSADHEVTIGAILDA